MTNCDHCGMMFKFPSQLEKHLSRKFPCFTKIPSKTSGYIDENLIYENVNKVCSKDNLVCQDVKKVHEEYKCSKCNKNLSTKAYLKKHEAKCNGLHSLQCPTCLKFFSDSSAKCKHIKNGKCKAPDNSNIHEPHKQSVYLLIEREFLLLKKNVFKIGRSENVSNRTKQYPNGSQLLVVLPCIDCKASENHLKEVFQKNFKHRADIGSEYFEGTPNLMIQTFIKNVEAHF